MVGGVTVGSGACTCLWKHPSRWVCAGSSSTTRSAALSRTGATVVAGQRSPIATSAGGSIHKVETRHFPAAHVSSTTLVDISVGV